MTANAEPSPRSARCGNLCQSSKTRETAIGGDNTVTVKLTLIGQNPGAVKPAHRDSPSKIDTEIASSLDESTVKDDPPDPEPGALRESRLGNHPIVDVSHTVEETCLGLRYPNTEAVESFDPRGHEPLATGHINRRSAAVQDHGRESSQVSLNCGGEPGRTTSDDDEIRTLTHDCGSSDGGGRVGESL